MWRRACLRVHDDTVTLFLVWLAGVIDVLLLGANARGWAWGATAAAGAGVLGQAWFRWRRARWDRRIRRESAQGLAAAEVLLGRKVE